MLNNNERQRLAYNQLAPIYDQQMSAFHRYTIGGWKSQCVGKDVLDLGCGTAYVLHAFLQEKLDFRSYTGVDIADEMVAANANRFKHLAQVSFIPGNAETLEHFDHGAFDVVISYGCLHHLDRPDLAVRNVARVLRPPGVFLAVEKNRRHPAESFIGLYAALVGLDPAAARRAVKRLVRAAADTSTSDTYERMHPGHPGKRTPVEYRAMLRDAGFHAIDVRCSHVDILPHQIYMSRQSLFDVVVGLSPRLMRGRTQDVGSVILIQAKKQPLS